MSTNKFRLGIVMAALAVVVGGPAFGAQTATASDTGRSGAGAATEAAALPAPTVVSAALDSYDWT